MNTQSQKTLLHSWHIRHSATMADFGGYEMPLWYASAKNEHLAVLTQVGLFDTSHMAGVLISGMDAFSLLQACFTNNLNACVGAAKRPLSPGKCVYGAFLDQRGWVIDDSIVYMLGENRYLAVVNAGMGGPVVAHLEAHRRGLAADILDLTNRLGKMDIQGPLAAKALKQALADPVQVYDRFPYFSFKGDLGTDSSITQGVRLADGTPILLSRTGYTGEFGFEIFTAPENLVKVWNLVIEAGELFGITACGLAARDSLRAGAVLPLSHQDIGDWPFIRHPWPFALPYNADHSEFTKSFIGDQALLNVAKPEYTYPFAGFDLRKVVLPATVLDADGQEIGSVLTCVTDMALGRHEHRIYSIVSPHQPEDLVIKGLCCGFVKTNKPLSPGEIVALQDSRRRIKVCIETDIRPQRTARAALNTMI